MEVDKPCLVKQLQVPVLAVGCCVYFQRCQYKYCLCETMHTLLHCYWLITIHFSSKYINCLGCVLFDAVYNSLLETPRTRMPLMVHLCDKTDFLFAKGRGPQSYFRYAILNTAMNILCKYEKKK